MNMVKIVKDVPVVSTLDMWEELKVEHSALIKMIRKYEMMFQEIRPFGFEIQKTAGRPTAFCRLDEEQATFLITMMKNSDVVVDFKFRLTREFYRAKRVIADLASQRQNAQWLETRNTGKQKRKVETDTIQRFVEYAKKQGSKNAERYYANISTMQNKALFFIEQKFKNIREILNLQQLSIVICADEIVTKAIEDGMAQGLHYKAIYKLVKERIENFAEIHGKTLIPMINKQIENLG